MRRTIERDVRGRFARFMRRRHWTGVCLVLPFWTVILHWLNDDPWAPEWTAHERAHAYQAERYGWIGFWVRYVWGMRKGYRGNPLEQQAREVAGQE